MKHSSLRDAVQWQTEHEAKKPYFTYYKGDTKNPQLSVDYKVWNSLENLEKAAYGRHPDVKNFWKWVKKTYPNPEDHQTLRLHLHNLVYFLVGGVEDEMKKWKEALLSQNYWYYPSCF
jgi:hypothetical protein